MIFGDHWVWKWSMTMTSHLHNSRTSRCRCINLRLPTGPKPGSQSQSQSQSQPQPSHPCSYNVLSHSHSQSRAPKGPRRILVGFPPIPFRASESDAVSGRLWVGGSISQDRNLRNLMTAPCLVLRARPAPDTVICLCVTEHSQSLTDARRLHI